MNLHHQRINICLIVSLCVSVEEVSGSEPFTSTFPSSSPILNNFDSSLLNYLNEIFSLVLVELELHLGDSSVQLSRVGRQVSPYRSGFVQWNLLINQLLRQDSFLLARKQRSRGCQNNLCAWPWFSTNLVHLVLNVKYRDHKLSGRLCHIEK